jgi:hypothetical protein
MIPKPEPGLVVRYSYLWRSEFLQGREEGIKDRPCAIIAAIAEEAGDRPRVLVLPVTHRIPENMDVAIEIPFNVKKHLRLDEEPSWIILSESNEFLWPGPDLRWADNADESSVAYGFLPPKLYAIVRQRFIALEEKQRAVRVPRTE